MVFLLRLFETDCCFFPINNTFTNRYIVRKLNTLRPEQFIVIGGLAYPEVVYKWLNLLA
ncbi:MAG: hypothetical protein Tsb0033_16260 [Winogradskyella sp.]